MKHILPSFAICICALLATELRAQADQPPTPNRRAEALMTDMLAAMGRHTSISAKIRQRVDVLGQQLVGTGLYLQQGRGAKLKVRLELKIQVADQTTSVQHVCDSTFLWIHEDLLDKSSLTRIDVERVRDALRERDGRRIQFETPQLALTGLPKLLETLNSAFEFRIVRQDRLDGVPVWVLRGVWRPSVLAEMFPDPKAEKKSEGQAPRAGGKLPAHAPDEIVMLIGRDDLFPYRIEFRRSSVTQPLVAMEWFEVAIDTPIDERQFIYRPGDANYTDGTDKLLERMGLAEKKAADNQ